MTRNRQAVLDANRKRAGLKCTAKLRSAADALHEYMHPCHEIGDASSTQRMGAGDGRAVLIGNVNEYADYLERVYKKDLSR